MASARDVPRPERPTYLRADAPSEWQHVVERLASEDQPITFVVGAGASIESGMPSWTELVHSLIEDVAPRLEEDERRAWIDAIEDEGPLPAAAIVRVLCRDEGEFRGLLKRRLYGKGGPDQFRPGALAEQIAWFKERFPDRTRIVTTNYDDLLEQALRTFGVRVQSRVNDRPEPSGVAYVYHLHGRLNARHRDRDIVLAESDYVGFQVAGGDRWQERLMRNALDSSLCVFVGLSFSDPNIIRWVYSHARGEHLAMFVRQSAPRLSPDVRRQVEHAARRRWEVANVQVAFADFYGEVAQLVHEAALLRLGGHPPFHERARARLGRGRHVVVPEGPVRFGRQQQRASQGLSQLIDWVRQIARSAGGRFGRQERLGLSLWGIDHERGELALWASDDRLYTKPDSIVPIPLEYASEWVAVEAVTQCKAVERDPGLYYSRWRYIRGIPLVWREADGSGRVPVGALALTSTNPHGQSALGALSEGSRREIDHVLQRVAVELFA